MPAAAMASAAHLLLRTAVAAAAIKPSILPRRSALILSTHRRFSVGVPQRVPAVRAPAARGRRGGAFSSTDDFVATPSDLEFEAPLKIVEYPDPILRARNKRIASFDDNLKKLVEEMFDVMYKTDGIGLSAPQVGLNIQLLVFNAAGERGIGEELVLINPKIQKFSQKQVLYDEGCLSFPGIYADVERPVSLKADARDISGAKFSVSLSGLPARVFQHEFDHLEGVLFFDRMTEEVLESIRSELQALEKKYETKNGLPSPERIDDFKKRKTGIGFGKKEAAGFGRS